MSWASPSTSVSRPPTGPASYPPATGHAALDAKVTRDFVAPIRTKIEQANLATVADIEMRAVPAFVWLTCSGAAIDANAWLAVATEAEERERSSLVERLDAAAPPREGCFGAGAWNWNSWQDVIEAFAVLGVKLASTNDAALAGVDHPLAVALREHRSASQMVKTFGRSWLDFIQEGRIYAGWVQLGTDAGRSSGETEPPTGSQRILATASVFRPRRAAYSSRRTIPNAITDCLQSGEGAPHVGGLPHG